MKLKIAIHSLLISIVAVIATLNSEAATKYWDTNGSDAGFGTAGGVWGADANWSSSSSGVLLPTVTNTTASDDLYFGTRDNGLGTGTISVEGSDQTFKTINFGDASGPITFSEGELSLAESGSSIRLNSATNTIASVISGSNDLHITQVRTLIYKEDYLTETSRTMFTNAVLAAYRSVGGIMNSAALDRRPAQPYYFVNDGTNATCQLQVKDGNHTKCIKVSFTQDGSDITGKAIYAKYVSGSNLGFDFDTGGTSVGIASSETNYMYGLERVSLMLTAKHYEPFLTETPVTVFKNTSLTDCADISAYMGGEIVVDSPVLASSRFFNIDGTNATVQFQIYNGAGTKFTKCVKIRLTQSGDDIVGQAVYAGYINAAGKNLIGNNFDNCPDVINKLISGTFTERDYGVCQLRIIDRGTLRLTAANTWSGQTVIDGGSLEFSQNGLPGQGTYTNNIINNGKLFCNSKSNQIISGEISGSGLVSKDAYSTQLFPEVYSSFLPAAPSKVTVLQDTDLDDCMAADGVMGGAGVAGGDGGLPGEAFFFTNDGTNATWQLQAIDGVWTKCVKIKITQVGDDIVGNVIYAKYADTDGVTGYDFDTQPATSMIISAHPSMHSYGAEETTLFIEKYSSLTLSGDNSYTGGTVVERGKLEAVGSSSSLPPSGGIFVKKEGELSLNVSGITQAGSVGADNPIYVQGGLLKISATFNAGASRPITIDGGSIITYVLSNDDSSNYMNNLTLMNGAFITGAKIRVGYMSDALIAVRGTNTCFLPAGITMVRKPEETWWEPLTLNVADATGDETADLIISGVIRDYPITDYDKMPMIKTGDGSVSLTAVNTYKGTITLTQGGLSLDCDNALNPDNDIVLNGGMLDMGAFDNALGTLSVDDTGSTIKLGSGTLVFADSSSESWSGTLSLTGTLVENSVRFGSGGTALTSSQLAAISYDGGRSVRLDANGYLTATPLGTVLVVK
ncbi:MAG: autotransporter-associated beta strand repeat-containing protein [Kiritimatiellia bacterium]